MSLTGRSESFKSSGIVRAVYCTFLIRKAVSLYKETSRMGNRVHTQTQQYVESLGNSKGSSEDAKNYLYCTGERA